MRYFSKVFLLKHTDQNLTKNNLILIIHIKKKKSYDKNYVK